MNTPDSPPHDARLPQPLQDWSPSEQQIRIQELTRWTIRLCAALRVGLPNSRHPDDAMRYLELNGLVKRPPALRPQTLLVAGTRTIQ